MWFYKLTFKFFNGYVTVTLSLFLVICYVFKVCKLFYMNDLENQVRLSFFFVYSIHRDHQTFSAKGQYVNEWVWLSSRETLFTK